MEEASKSSLVNRDDPIPVVTISGSEDSNQSGHSSSSKRHHLRNKLSVSKLKEKAREHVKHESKDAGKQEEESTGGSGSLHDRLFTKLLQQIVPSEDLSDMGDSTDPRSTKYIQRPGFTLPLMTRNFRRFNARIGVVFVFQARLLRVLTWQTTSHTLSFLAIYTFICLDPSLLIVLPVAITLFFVMVPAFTARHPPPPTSTLTSRTAAADAYSYWTRGPPLAPPASIKPVSEMSKDFIRNMRDLQNSMEDFSRLHDEIVKKVGPPTNFSNESLSSALFLFLFTTTCLLFLVSSHLPWRFIFLTVGWAAICAGHPTLSALLLSTHEDHFRPRERQAGDWITAWIARDIELDSAPELREVEVFELQRHGGHGDGQDDIEWERWLFSQSPHDPLSAERVTGDRPSGAAFFEDVQPPSGWEWSDKKWTVDLLSREWVEERMITGVEVETEGERWVYDIAYDDDEHDHHDDDERSIYEHDEHDHSHSESGRERGQERKGNTPKKLKKKVAPKKRRDWEEGPSGMGKRGVWRRRRWVRLVKRRSSL
ncbi:MAG: hypothetical protein M4579_002094 [Chaenotheca gracillima]|nr:MAG: hypothetical protein M4579_002094 [Chaenotheca gracillima]